jgi:hypothetical protein
MTLNFPGGYRKGRREDAEGAKEIRIGQFFLRNLRDSSVPSVMHETRNANSVKEKGCLALFKFSQLKTFKIITGCRDAIF